MRVQVIEPSITNPEEINFGLSWREFRVTKGSSYPQSTYYFFVSFSDKGGDRVAWSKQWIASPDIWTYRANFDSRVSI